MKPTGNLPLTAECHHYTSRDEVPWDIQKYWSQRYSIFSNYDDGIVLTDEGWFGVTPEPVASVIAADITEGWPHPKTTIVDLFAGTGGNTIAFALSGQFKTVIGIEKDAATLACAQHNASIHEVPARSITWVLGDCFEFLDKALGTGSNSIAPCHDGDEMPDGQIADLGSELDPLLKFDPASTILFGSPPWGGPGYRTDQVFDLSQMEPYNLAKLHGACRQVDHALYLPRTSDIRQIARLIPDGETIDVVQYCMQGASKAIVAYIPGQPSTTQP